MEGKMQMWHGLRNIGTWKTKYFILKDNVLQYFDKKRGVV